MKFLRTRRVSDGVGDTPIYIGEPRGCRVSQPGRSHRRRLYNEDVKAVAPSVARKIDQDVDAVPTYARADCVEVQIPNVAPVVY